MLAFSAASSTNIGYVCHLPVCFVLDAVVGLILQYGMYGSELNTRQ
jgi:hypothetical protein